jgi:3'(2'), 5'-bisphosphate nucleotidase
MTEIQLTDKAILAAILAGEAIMKVYSTDDFNVRLKSNNTPVTLADYQAQEIILRTLETTGLPVLSEEKLSAPYAERKDWNLFWMIDPLDGTKEFIKRNGEFTVNIALIKRNKPVAGVIYAPVIGELYAAIEGIGAWKIINPESYCNFQVIQQSGTKLPVKKKTDQFTIAISRSHLNSETEAFIKKMKEEKGQVHLKQMGSSLKTCMVAEGMADVYPRFGTTMEWDTAAGQAIAKAAGKNIFLPDLKTELTYNKENLQNPDFIAI